MALITALFALITMAALFVPTTLGSLYPTRPVANTVLQAGRQESLAWIDNGSTPTLADIPKLQLDLHNPDNTLAKTFSKSVDPKAKKFDVWVSPTLGMNSSGYYFRFHGGSVDVYTARFTITDLAGGASSNASTTVKPPAAIPVPTQNAAAASLFPAPTALAAMALSGLPSVTSAAAGGVPSPNNLIPTIPPISTAMTVSAPSATLVSHTVVTAVQNGAASLFNFDTDALKFQVMFVLWPAVMGISLAL